MVRVVEPMVSMDAVVTTGRPVAFEILVHADSRLRVQAGSGHNATLREEIAAADDIPREILVGGAFFQAI